MSQPHRTISTLPIPLIALILLAYSATIAFLTGNIGFEGDDWWIFSWAYWNGFPDSLFVYARESLRPVEGIYYITLFELFGFNKVAFHLISLLLLTGSCTLMALSIETAFPGRHTLATTAAFLAFFAPMVSCLTFVTTTDNSRLSMLFFWACVPAFQRWARKSAALTGLIVPVFFYLLAFFTYESTSFLILAVPFLVLPVHLRSGGEISNRAFIWRLVAAITISLTIAVSVRFLFLNGGIVRHRHVLPPFELVWSYLALLPIYLAEPFVRLSRSPFAWLLGFGVVSALGYLFYRFPDENREKAVYGTSWWNRVEFYPFLLGLSILFLGMLPYQLAGYGSVIPKITDSVMHEWGFIPNGNSAWFNFNWSSRIYSSATFGLAILFALAVEGWKGKWLRRVAKAAAIVVIGFFTIFHAGMIPEWQEASRIRAGLGRDLLSQVPDVKPGTNFAFLNLDSRYARAVIFRGWMGVRALVEMLYDERQLGAWYLYPYSHLEPNHIFQQAFVSPKGFVSRGLKMDEPIPLQSLIIFNKTGRHLVLLNKISAMDGLAPTGISWKGVSAIQSNVNRIVHSRKQIADPRRSALNKALRKAVTGRQDCLAREAPTIAGTVRKESSLK